MAEADEYDRSFLYLHPEVAIINNIETDHLEYYGSAEAIFGAFGEFALNVKRGGLLLLCADDAGARRLGAELARGEVPFRLQYFGLGKDALWRASSIKVNERGGSDFAVVRDGKELARLSVQVPGVHNVLNALGAFAALSEVGLAPEVIARWLGEFEGLGGGSR